MIIDRVHHRDEGLVQADGILRDGVGAISTGRGGTNLGFADNGNIILDNPGALVNIDANGLAEVGVDVLITDLTYSDPDNAEMGAADNPFPMGQLSFVRKSADGNVAWGLGAFAQAGFSPKYELNGPFPFQGPQTYKSIGAMMRVLPGLSIALTPRLSVGGTLGVAISHTELEGPYFTQAATPFQGTPTLLDLQGTGAELSWSAGLQYQISPSTTLGASFQSETHIDANGSATLTVPGLGMSRFDLDLETQWPSTAGSWPRASSVFMYHGVRGRAMDAMVGGKACLQHEDDRCHESRIRGSAGTCSSGTIPIGVA